MHINGSLLSSCTMYIVILNFIIFIIEHYWIWWLSRKQYAHCNKLIILILFDHNYRYLRQINVEAWIIQYLKIYCVYYDDKHSNLQPYWIYWCTAVIESLWQYLACVYTALEHQWKNKIKQKTQQCANYRRIQNTNKKQSSNKIFHLKSTRNGFWVNVFTWHTYSIDNDFDMRPSWLNALNYSWFSVSGGQ